MKIVTVLGARPQFIKGAVLSRLIKDDPDIEEYIIHTGQHFSDSMSKVFFDELDIPKPNCYLGINSLSHGAMTGRMLEKIEKVLIKQKPDIVLVYGDTNSTLSGALAASKLNIPIAHVEAGLRCWNREVPEEINRYITDHISTYNFCPTENSFDNLSEEDLSGIIVGDVMYDSFLYYKKRLNENLFNVKSWTKPYFLVTLHRQGNTDSSEKVNNFFETLESLVYDLKIPFVFPVHPRIKKFIQKKYVGVNFIDPVGYLDMINLELNSSLILTDSGGVQKEAYFSKVPCVVLRDETEWTQLVDIGACDLAGLEKEDIKNSINEMLKRKISYKNLFGSGDSGQKILHELKKK